MEDGPATTGIAIVGTGFAGLGMAITLTRAGYRDFVVLERSQDVGGTWRDNTYPGCQCDVPSNLYSFSFAPNPDWTRTFPTQPELLAYLRRCARDFGIMPKIRFGCALESAAWDERAHCWRLQTSRGALAARILITGNGGLSEPALPEVQGLEKFRGAVFHSAQWDPSADLRGRRVAVIGTGASSIQIVPKVQPQAGHLDVYQRTPAWIMPHPDRAVSALEKRIYKTFPLLQRAVRAGVYWGRETWAFGFARQPAILRAAQRLALRHLARQVHDPALRAALTPSYAMGCKRILISDEFYPAMSRPNVELVTGPVTGVTETGVVAADGTERPTDVIIFGTGFKVSDNPFWQRLTGSGGTPLMEAWSERAAAYLGTTVSGFPNLFMLTGPNTGLGHTSMVFIMESQFAYIMGALRTMGRRRATAMTLRPGVQDAWVREIDSRMSHTVWSAGCRSWYLDANGHNTALWPGFSWAYRQRTRHFDPESYEFSVRTGVPAEVPAGAGGGVAEPAAAAG